MIEKAYENRDLLALEKLAKPTKRVLNKRDDFSSVLMLSANNIKHLKKIESLEADCIMINLEDGVSPEDKPFALYLSAIFLSKIKQSDKKIVIRVNPLGEGGEDEIKYLNKFMPDAIRVPKINNKYEVEKALELIDDDIELHLSIESAESWNNLSTLRVDKRVTSFYLGVLDLFADMKLSHDIIKTDNPTMLYILSHFLITSKAMGVKPVSFVYQEFKKLKEFGMWLELEKSMGYDSKGCISPKQVELVNKIFLKDETLITRAKTIVKLFQENQKNGITGFVDDEFGFIDEPIYKGALATLKGMR
jgi:citrate lyase subunit beta/citryl-CoA lyase